jgi:hypothetical protein
MTKESDLDKQKNNNNIDYIDIPVEQQKFSFTYVISEDLKK